MERLVYKFYLNRTKMNETKHKWYLITSALGELKEKLGNTSSTFFSSLSRFMLLRKKYTLSTVRPKGAKTATE